jgi:hypothetical protein
MSPTNVSAPYSSSPVINSSPSPQPSLQEILDKALGGITVPKHKEHHQ